MIIPIRLTSAPRDSKSLNFCPVQTSGHGTNSPDDVEDTSDDCLEEKEIDSNEWSMEMRSKIRSHHAWYPMLIRVP